MCAAVIISMSEAQRLKAEGELAETRAAHEAARSKMVAAHAEEVVVQGSHSARTRHCICALFSLWRVHCVWYRFGHGSSPPRGATMSGEGPPPYSYLTLLLPDSDLTLTLT